MLVLAPTLIPVYPAPATSTPREWAAVMKITFNKLLSYYWWFLLREVLPSSILDVN